MSHLNVHVIRGMYDVVAAGDGPSVVEARNTQIAWLEAEHVPYADDNPYRGPLAVVIEVFGRLSAGWQTRSTTASEALPGAGDTVETFGRYAATHEDAGAAIAVQFVRSWQLQNGEVVGSQGYADTAQVAAAMARD